VEHKVTRGCCLDIIAFDFWSFFMAGFRVMSGVREKIVGRRAIAVEGMVNFILYQK
jgi:hypothetical protein